VAVANWPGHVPAGSVVDQPIHIVDMFPTLAGLAGAPAGKGKPLDGMNVWPAISEGKPSPRTEVVYDIEPFRAALRQGNLKLVWRVVLPSQVELFDLATDPGEKTNIADRNPRKVAELKERIEALSREAVQPLLIVESLPALKNLLSSTVALPADVKENQEQP
jgi:arylsulfatase A-like enzyme